MAAKARTQTKRRVARRSPRRLPLKGLLNERSKIINLMASGAPLPETLTAIAKMVERLAPPALCSVLLLQPDGKHLRHGAGPSLPAEYSRAINDLEIGPSVGSCGTAAYRKKPVIVTDIASDPLWEGPREFTLSFGLRACWSMPIISHTGVVLGTIAMYYRRPRRPTPHEFGLLKPGAELVRLALAYHRKAEELRAAEIRNVLAVEAAGFGTFMIELATREVVWSDRMKEIAGIAPDAPIEPGTFFNLVHPEDRQMAMERFRRWAGADAQEPRNIRYRAIRQNDGAERVLQLRGRVVTNAQGVPTHAIGICADITDQLAAERKQEDTQRQIHELQKMEAIGQLAGGIAHDLNNTLMPILGLTKLAMQELSPLDPLGEHLALVHRAGERARDLVNQILAFSRKEEIARGPVELGSLLNDFLPLLKVGAPATVTIESHVTGNPVVWANRGQMDQVLTNLVTNALQAIGNNLGTIRVEIDADPVQKMARVAVIDNGPGIDPAIQKRLFEPFFTTKAVGTGTGLGLAVAHGIVSHHGGRIEVTSGIGQGATFEVFLPLFKQVEPAAALLETAA